MAIVFFAAAYLAIAGCQRNANAPVSTPQVVPVMQSKQPLLAPTQPPALTVPSASAVARQGEVGESMSSATAACLGGDQLASAPHAAASIHRWTDAGGITHYSDLGAPRGATNAAVIAINEVPPISVHATGYDGDLPDQVEQRAAAAALAVQRVMHAALGVSAPNLSLEVVFVRSPENYAKLIEDPALASSAGAYSTAKHTVYVRMQADDTADFTILRHELTHALIHDSVGNLPTSLNEGLAEFFSRMQVVGLGAHVDFAADHAALRAASAGDVADALVDLLARDGRDFYAVDGVANGNSRERHSRYTQAYALVATLMQNTAGRAALSAVLAAQRADPCHPVAAETILDARYPNGLRALSIAWFAFMRGPPAEIEL